MPGKKAFNLYRKFTTIICITNIFLKCRTTHYYKLMTTVLVKRKKQKKQTNDRKGKWCYAKRRGSSEQNAR